jgi:hypothetical protein
MPIRGHNEVRPGTRQATRAVFRDALVGHVRVTLGGHDG